MVLVIRSLISLGYYLLFSCYIILGVGGPIKFDYIIRVFSLRIPFIIIVV